jgi:hypothetical protein
MVMTGSPVCNVSTFAIVSARYDLNLFKSKLLGLVTAIASVELGSPVWEGGGSV